MTTAGAVPAGLPIVLSAKTRSDTRGPFSLSALLTVLAASSAGCTSLCHYTVSGTVASPPSVSKSLQPPLVDVVRAALRPLGFSGGSDVHNPGYPLGHQKSEPDRDYIDFTIGVPAEFWSLSLPANQVMVRVEPASGNIWISDLKNDATRKESKFVTSVRQSIQHQVLSSYGLTLDMERVHFTSAQCVLASWP